MTPKEKNLWKLTKRALFLVFCLFSFSVFAQNRTVRGTVKDASGEPLIGVTVQIQGTSSGTVTDMDGRFELENVPANAVLDFSYVGMQPQSVAVNGRSTIDITMREDVAALDEVVVVGYGTQLRREVTGSIANVSEKDFNKGIT